MNELTVESNLKNKIHTIRGKQVILDRDLAELYDVETRILNQSVKRNIGRFPEEFMFKLTEKEIDSLVSQFVTPSKQQLGGAKPYAFTEQGVAMLAGVLRSKKAIEVSIEIIKLFVEMRKYISRNSEIFS